MAQVSNMDFCSECGSIMPVLQKKGDLICYTCKTTHKIEALDSHEVHYVLHFNSIESGGTQQEKKKKKTKETEAEGPVCERKCPKCGNDVMSYATLQLRSADEGQTVFYTCTKCKYKETENS